MKNIFNLLSVVMLLSANVKGQDPLYSNVCCDPLYLNPALAGSEKGLSANATIRYQWPKITSEFATYSAGISSLEPNLGGGVGLHFMQNVEGEGYQKTTEFSFLYAYRIYVKRKLDIGMGLRVAHLQRSIDFSRFVYSDQLDPVNGVIYPTQAEVPAGDKVSVFNAATGLDIKMYTSKRQRTYFNFGLSANNITQPNFSLLYLESRLPIRFSTYFSIVLPGNPYSGRFAYLIKPMLMHTRQGPSPLGKSALALTVVGLESSTDHLFLGTYYRSAEVVNLPRRDALYFFSGIHWQSRESSYSFGYGYEVTVSNIAPNTGGAHEVCIKANRTDFRFFKRLNSFGKRRLKHCPDFKAVGGLKTL